MRSGSQSFPSERWDAPQLGEGVSFPSPHAGSLSTTGHLPAICPRQREICSCCSWPQIPTTTYVETFLQPPLWVRPQVFCPLDLTLETTPLSPGFLQQPCCAHEAYTRGYANRARARFHLDQRSPRELSPPLLPCLQTAAREQSWELEVFKAQDSAFPGRWCTSHLQIP